MSRRIDWASGTPREEVLDYVQWRAAVERADAGDRSAIVDMLRSEVGFGPDARDLVADLIQRHRLTKPKGGQTKPSYKITMKEGRLRQMASLVRYYRNKGMGRDAAIEAALRERKREALAESGDYTHRSDADVDALISTDERESVHNFVKRGGQKTKRTLG